MFFFVVSARAGALLGYINTVEEIKVNEGAAEEETSPVPKLRMGVTINVVFDKFKITSLKFK